MMSEGTFEVAGLDLTRLEPIYKKFVGLVIDKGMLGVSGRYSFVKDRAESPANATAVAVSLDGLKLRDPAEKKPFLSIDTLSISNASADPGLRTLGIGVFNTTGGVADVVRMQDGGISFMKLLSPPGAQATKPVTAPRTGAKPKPWLVEMGSMTVARYAVNFRDMTPKAEALNLSVRDIGVSLKGFSTDPAKSATLSVRARVDKRGAVSADGSVALDPVRLNLAVRARDIAVWLAEPYV